MDGRNPGDGDEAASAPGEARVATDGGEADGEDRDVASIELNDGDWLHDHEPPGEDPFEAAEDAEAQREADAAERSAHLEEMARDVATDLLRTEADGVGEGEAAERADELVDEFRDDRGINRWNEDDVDEFETWAAENIWFDLDPCGPAT